MEYTTKTRSLFATLQLTAGLCLITSQLQSGDWPHWRGPNRDGTAQETGLARMWSAEGPKLLWQLNDLGYGFGTPAIVGDLVFVVSNEGMDNEYVKALRLDDGKEVWTTSIGKVGKPDQRPNYPGARSTPAIVGEFVYALGSDGDLVCLSKASGEVRWKRSLESDFGGISGKWAYAESPLVDEDLVVITPSGEDATMVALNKNTGELVWKTAISGNKEAGYASAVIAVAGSLKQYVAFLGSGLVGLDPKSGSVLWEYDRINGNSQTTPVAHHGFVYTSANRSGAALVRLSAEQGGVDAEEVYFNNKLPSGTGGTVVIGDHLYGSGGSTLMCVNFSTGELVWEERSLEGASICAADGMLFLHGTKGDMALIEASPEGYREVGRFDLPNQPDRGRGGRAMTAPVVANGKLFVRDLGALWCYDIK